MLQLEGYSRAICPFARQRRSSPFDLLLQPFPELDAGFWIKRTRSRFPYSRTRNQVLTVLLISSAEQTCDLDTRLALPLRLAASGATPAHSCVIAPLAGVCESACCRTIETINKTVPVFPAKLTIILRTNGEMCLPRSVVRLPAHSR